MTWKTYINGFKAFLQLEKSLADNSIEAYLHDVEKFIQYMEIKNIELLPEKIKLKHLQDFIFWINEIGVSISTQSRIISGIKAFYKYLLIENIVNTSPCELLESPRIGRKLPDTLNISEIDKIISAIDLSKPEGIRNKAIIETLYACGLRVSELVNLKISNLYIKESFIKVTGKGDKERLVPIGKIALKNILLYKENTRNHILIKKGNEDILFLNRLGSKLSRVMIFLIIKGLVEQAGIRKTISPHTFRHSFASHLVDGGADLRVVQEMLGHESITTTEIYTHLDREYLRSAILDHHPRSRKT